MAVPGGQILGFGQLSPAANRSPQDAVHQARSPGIGILFALLHRLMDGGGVGDFIHIENLIQAQAQNVQHHRLQIPEPAPDQLAQVKIQKHPVLEHAVAQPGCQSRVPPVQPVSLGVFLQHPVGPGALLPAGNERP